MSLPALVGVVVALAAVMPLAAHRAPRWAGNLGAIVLTACTGWLLYTAPGIIAGGTITYRRAWLPDGTLDLALRMDALAWIFAVIVVGIGAVVLAYTSWYLEPHDPRTARVLTLLAAFAAAMLALVLADDVVLLFVCWELTTVISWLLIAGNGSGRRPATRAFVVTAAGGLALLVAAVWLRATAGTGSLAAIAREGIADTTVAAGVALLVVVAAATKSAQLPFAFWLPGAMVAPTPVSTYLHAATMVKAGIYLLLRFSGVIADAPGWSVSLTTIGFATAVFGAVVALRADDLKRLLAYSTVSQLGVLVGLIGFGGPHALAAATLHTLAHALFKSTLFMATGAIERSSGTRNLRVLRRRRLAPGLPSVVAVAAASMAGLPPMIGFISKEAALDALLGAPSLVGAMAATTFVIAGVGTVAYSLRIVRAVAGRRVARQSDDDVVHATADGAGDHDRRVDVRATTLVGLPAFVGLGLGVSAGITGPLLDTVAVTLSGVDPELSPRLWHGVTAALMISLAMVAVGATLGWWVDERTTSQTESPHRRWPDGAAAFDRIDRAVQRVASMIGTPAGTRSAASHLVAVVTVAIVVGITAARPFTGAPAASTPPADWVIVGLLAAGVIGVAQARSRIVAVAMLGLTGFVVAGWFVLLGGPDLALTQLLVETLTVTLVVVVFRRLPDTFQRGRPPRKAGALVVALAAGTLATLATLHAAARQGPGNLGRRYLAEAESLTGGSNVVNTILVDFRALDTLGEVAVLAVAAMGILALVRLTATDALEAPDTGVEGPSHGTGPVDTIVLRTVSRILAPVMIAASVWLTLRGHDAVGGGFIGGLTAGAAVVLLYLSRGHRHVWDHRLLRIEPLTGTGVAIAAGYGLAGIAITGTYLAGGKFAMPGVGELAASLVFDVGVYLVVIAIVVAILRHLGQGRPEDPPVDGRRPADAVLYPAGQDDPGGPR